MSFAAKLISGSARVYCLQYDAGTKEACYFFLKLDPAKEAFFKKAVEAGSTAHKLEDFGTVVASGWGEPAEDIKQAMAEKYDISFNA